MLYINSKLPNTNYDELSRNDKKAICNIDSLFKDNNLNKIEVPLMSSIDLEKQSEFCTDVKTLVRIQYAIYNISSIVFSREVRKDTENKDFFVYFANRVTTADKELEKLFTEAKKSDKKRESSKKVTERAEAKAKAKAEAEAKADDDWNVRATKELSKYLVTRFKIKTTELNGVETELLRILRSIK